MASIVVSIVVVACWFKMHRYSTFLPAAYVLAVGQSIATLMEGWAERNLGLSKDD